MKYTLLACLLSFAGLLWRRQKTCFIGLLLMRRVTGSQGYAGNWRSSSRSRALIPAVWGLPAQSESKADCEDTHEEKSGEARYFLKTVSASASLAAYADHQSSSICSSQLCWRSNQQIDHSLFNCCLPSDGFFTLPEAIVFGFNFKSSGGWHLGTCRKFVWIAFSCAWTALPSQYL